MKYIIEKQGKVLDFANNLVELHIILDWLLKYQGLEYMKNIKIEKRSCL